MNIIKNPVWILESLVCGMQSQAVGIDRYMYSVSMCALSYKRLNFTKGADWGQICITLVLLIDTIQIKYNTTQSYWSLFDRLKNLMYPIAELLLAKRTF